MIGSSKNSTENYQRKCFWTQEKETCVKFNPGLSANRPLNNWALGHTNTQGLKITEKWRYTQLRCAVPTLVMLRFRILFSATTALLQVYLEFPLIHLFVFCIHVLVRSDLISHSNCLWASCAKFLNGNKRSRMLPGFLCWIWIFLPLSWVPKRIQ